MNFYNFRKNEKGAALISVVLVLIVIIMISSAIISITVTESKISSNDKSAVQALYLAEGGIQIAVDYLYNNPYFRGEMLENDIDFSDGSITSVAVADYNSLVKVTSTAEVNKIKKK